MSSPSKSPTMEPPPVQQSHPHPKASNSVTEATANCGSPSHKPLQQLPHEAAARTRTRTRIHHHVANNGASSSAAQEADHRFSDEEEELNNFNNNQKKQQDAFLSSFPPGYRFNPRDEELVRYYLQKKIMDEPLPPNKIMEVNLYRHNPETLAGKYDTYGEKEWYFFTPRDRKYRNGKRPNRKAGDGYWKATGADKSIKSGNVEVGFRKALVFYNGKPPKGKKTNWIMHEYRVPDSRTVKRTKNDMRLDNWVLCRIYKKVDNKNKIQEADLAEENISMSILDDTEMEMNGQVDNTQATKSKEEYPHTIAHPPLEFDRAYSNFAYHYTSYPDQPMIDALSNNMRHHLIQPVAFDSKDSYGNMYHSLPTRGSSSAMQSLDENCIVPFSEHKHGCSVHLIDMTSESVVCKEEGSDQKYGVRVQFPGQKYVVQSPEQEKMHYYGKSVQPSDAVDSRHNPSTPCLDQKSIQQEIGKSLLSPPSDDLPYCIQEPDDEHDNILFSDSYFRYSEVFPWV